MEAVISDGCGPLGVGRLNLVGQGRAGKSALARALEGLPFVDTASTAGAEQRLMTVDHASLDAEEGSGGAWRRTDSRDGSEAVSAEWVAAQVRSARTPCQGDWVPLRFGNESWCRLW